MLKLVFVWKTKLYNLYTTDVNQIKFKWKKTNEELHTNEIERIFSFAWKQENALINLRFPWKFLFEASFLEKLA